MNVISLNIITVCLKLLLISRSGGLLLTSCINMAVVLEASSFSCLKRTVAVGEICDMLAKTTFSRRFVIQILQFNLF